MHCLLFLLVLLQLLRTGGPGLLDDLSLAKQCKVGENISTWGHELQAKCKSCTMHKAAEKFISLWENLCSQYQLIIISGFPAIS